MPCRDGIPIKLQINNTRNGRTSLQEHKQVNQFINVIINGSDPLLQKPFLKQRLFGT